MALLESVFNHLVLPPKLPGHRDTDIEGVEKCILNRLIHACGTLGQLADQSLDGIWSSTRESLLNCMDVNTCRLEKASVQKELRHFQPKKFLILHVAEQNAALLLRHVNGDNVNTVIFESFEASPSSEHVLATANALQWDFPGRAAEIPLNEFSNESFQESLAVFLEQASIEPLRRFAARSVKAKTSVIEARDTTDPGLIIQMLMPLLEAVGTSVDVPRLRKRIRDDVNISDAEFPWRRLPFWLVLRVAVQRQCCITLGNNVGRACYKLLLCTVLAELLEDCYDQLLPELTMMLKAKLCRRLAKLEMNKNLIPPGTSAYQQLFRSVSTLFKKTLSKATNYVESTWSNFKKTSIRAVPKLPLWADEPDLHLSLLNSENYFSSLLTLRHAQRADFVSREASSADNGEIDQFQTFTDHYFKLAELERNIEAENRHVPQLMVDCQTRCVKLAKSIINVFTIVGDAYDASPEQMSTFILNLFDLWVEMDKCAVKACPLLAKYHPLFNPGLLDVLQVPTLSAMRRLRDVQVYLRDRSTNCQYEMTILSEPRQNCFTTNYLNQHVGLQSLRNQIENASELSRENKRREWTTACEKYDKLSQQISDGVCVCSFNHDGSRNVSGCKKCWQRRCRKRMNIAVHEDFLPEGDILTAAVVFELEVPEFLAMYRNTTWRILCDLAHPTRPSTSLSPAMHLRNYSQLKCYLKSARTDVSLASVDKSFLQTHFKALKMKVSLSDISFPLGLKFSYFDTKSGIWLKDLNQSLTFQHLCGVHIPSSLKTSVIQLPPHPPAEFHGPTSYEIVASQTKCPANMTIHEFMAYQRLLSGKLRRWPTMLVELGASNMNFSTEDTMLVFSQLAIQAGPAGTEFDLLRDVHFVFRDKFFCQCLIEQINVRFGNIISNWREMHCMEMLITLGLRVYSLASDQNRRLAELFLNGARAATLQWITRLRDERRNVNDANTAERISRYGFWAALLCRRTFSVFVESGSDVNENDLLSFIQASVALQENLVIEITKLPLNLRNLLIRDTKMAYRIQSTIQKSIETNPEILGESINQILCNFGGFFTKSYSAWRFLKSPNNRWVESILTSKTNYLTFSQVIQYNFVEGHLLVDGKPLGILPRSIRESEDFKDLFGNQHLLTYPSPLEGMSHAVRTPIPGHQIHIGIRGKNVVIRAVTQDGLLEYVPRSVFVSRDDYDLPFFLIENCVHWLNLRSKRLEIRRRLSLWKTRLSDWVLDIPKRRAQRKKVYLVDPRSDLCRRIAGIFRGFEDAQRITVYQPISGRLCVEMRHLELSFFVNSNNFLQCQELNAEIDPNQDAGTLYGFESKVVLRDVANSERRSIITALGPLSYRRHGIHVVVRACSINEYGRFKIDDVLGRLSCPPEPLLIYSKVLFHAFTSFVLPDSLTGRTGAEEALYTLRSGYSQPWTVVNNSPASILNVIKRLSPVREYYPKDKRRLQTVTWDKDLTIHIQNDRYETLVKHILSKSDQLQAFALSAQNDKDLNTEDALHLRTRGETRLSLYERSISEISRPARTEDIIYEPRDRSAGSPQAANVYQTVRLIRKQPFKLYMKTDLATLFQNRKIIGGFHEVSDKVPNCLNDLIENCLCEQWGSLVNFCRHINPQDSYTLIFRLGLLSFDTKPDMDIIKSLVAFNRIDELRNLQPPSYSSFLEYKHHGSPTIELLQKLISYNYPNFIPDPKWKRSRQDLEREKYKMQCETEGQRFAQHLLRQWPNLGPSTDDFESTILDIRLIEEKILAELQPLYENLKLSEYLDNIQKILNHHKGTKDGSMPRAYNMKFRVLCKQNNERVGLSIPEDLLIKRGPNLWNTQPLNYGPPTSRDRISNANLHNNQNQGFHVSNTSKEIFELGKILDSFIMSPDVLRQEYGTDLRNSLEALKSFGNNAQFQEQPPNIKVIRENIEVARLNMHDQFNNIRNAFSNDDRFQWLQLGNLWPCTSPISILEQLRSSSNHRFGIHMREGLVSSGVLITTLQRLLRIKDALLKNDKRALFDEWQNAGHENWDPSDITDWLLLEVDSDILIRREQIDVAHAIISPSSGSNSVLQMNMGKGKTSCIVPMAAAILANKLQLSRLIVPKALLLQTAQTVQSRLGGLVGREISHVPFSRRTPTTPNMLQSYEDIHRKMHQCSGVILTTPEHILSFKLNGLQRLADKRINEAKSMIEFQSWLNRTCRDVLDESDFTLAVKTQLIYPSGPQSAVDGHPYRWEVAETLLSHVEDRLPELQQTFPESIKVAKRSQGFPMVSFLQNRGEEALHWQLIIDICDGRIPLFRLVRPLSPADRTEIKRILLEKKIDTKLVKQVARFFTDKFSSFKKLLLVRGLLLNGILLLCLKKRWNVQYGLHPNRDPIAVPFEAKGIPSEQAEFGHPDVAIIFTCLAFYYSGLNFFQLSECLRYLLRSDDPAAEYDRWTSGCHALPEALRHWSVINVDDRGQVEGLWRHLRYNRSILNCYLNNFVFPIHAKQFGVKLQASGWDLPLFSDLRSSLTKTSTITTGFSGTNDNKNLLPLTIKQDDLPTLLQTNAEVLTYFLQERNRGYTIASRLGHRLTEEEFLQKITSMGIRVLIDAGAYILEMNNRDLVKLWLSIDVKAKAAVYFETDNRAWVQYRGGKEKVPLLATPFAERFEECLVYLDEAHTRGVDLKLPQDARGALTVALGQMKDHTVQAAMRLRQLGTTQSIIMIAPPEVHQSILDVCKKRQGEKINSSHVIHWLLEQTCRANEQLQNLYIAQGMDFCHRKNAEREHAKFLTDKNQRKSFLNSIQYSDRLTLEQLYGGAIDIHPTILPNLSSTELNSFVGKLNYQKQMANTNGFAIHSSALEEVEQEREVESQVEEIRQVEKPIHFKALDFPGLHPAISQFVNYGLLKSGHGYEHALTAVSRTKIGQKYNLDSSTSRIFISAEFMRTIHLDKSAQIDEFLRPVEWILWCASNETALIIIPEEAELVISMIRGRKKHLVHLITYAAPVTKNMLHFDHLSYYVIPPFPDKYVVPSWLSAELGLFAGRLYMNWPEYTVMKDYLGLEDPDTIATNHSAEAGPSSHNEILTQDPTNFLLDWLTLRRKGQDIMHTPMGFICQGRSLSESHPFFAVRGAEKNIVVPELGAESWGTGGGLRDDNEEEEEEENSDLEQEWDAAN